MSMIESMGERLQCSRLDPKLPVELFDLLDLFLEFVFARDVDGHHVVL